MLVIGTVEVASLPAHEYDEGPLQNYMKTSRYYKLREKNATGHNKDCVP